MSAREQKVWKCDFCNGESTTNGWNTRPKGWRHFWLSEFDDRHSPVGQGTGFDACETCVVDRYASMPPIRRILCKLGIWRTKP